MTVRHGGYRRANTACDPSQVRCNAGLTTRVIEFTGKFLNSYYPHYPTDEAWKQQIEEYNTSEAETYEYGYPSYYHTYQLISARSATNYWLQPAGAGLLARNWEGAYHDVRYDGSTLIDPYYCISGPPRLNTNFYLVYMLGTWSFDDGDTP